MSNWRDFLNFRFGSRGIVLTMSDKLFNKSKEIKHRKVTLFIDVSAFGLFQNYEILQIYYISRRFLHETPHKAALNVLN